MGKLLIVIAIAILVIIAGPFVTIWSLNTLFPILAIPFSFETWLAAFLLFGAVTGLRFSNGK